MNYHISRLANADIEAICNHIAMDNPAAADRLDRRFHEAAKLLAEFPGIGHHRADVTDGRYRFWAVGQYVIAYRLEGQRMIVVRILHGARDFRQIFHA